MALGKDTAQVSGFTFHVHVLIKSGCPCSAAQKEFTESSDEKHK